MIALCAGIPEVCLGLDRAAVHGPAAHKCTCRSAPNGTALAWCCTLQQASHRQAMLRSALAGFLSGQAVLCRGPRWLNLTVLHQVVHCIEVQGRQPGGGSVDQSRGQSLAGINVVRDVPGRG